MPFILFFTAYLGHWTQTHEDPDMQFILFFTTYPTLEVPKSPVRAMFSCMHERGEEGREEGN